MRLFIGEFLTGGGLCSQPLPPHLLADAHRMFDALLSDLRDIEGLELITTRDARLAPIPESRMTVHADDDPWVIWSECLRASDAAWLIAPESGGILLALRHLADACHSRFIGCEPEAIRIATSKTATLRCIANAGIEGIETAAVSEPLPAAGNGWIIKPDDGAGCEDTFYFTDPGHIAAWRDRCEEIDGYIVQPRIEGTHASLSVLYGDHHCEILARNEQAIVFDDYRLRADAPRVMTAEEGRSTLLPFVEAVGRAVPGLRGYVGIDFIDHEKGPVLVEVNPRLTTSYAGLHGVLDFNPAARILRIFGYPVETTDPVVF